VSTQPAGLTKRGCAGQIAAKVRNRVRAGGIQFWTFDDFSDLDSRAADKALVRMVAMGELHRVRRGLYYRGDFTLFGMSRPTQEDVALRVAGYGVGPAGLSAANQLGLTTQMPGQDVYAVPAPAPRDLPTIRFISRPARPARARAKLRPAEVALLEVLDSWVSVSDLSPYDTETRLVEVVRSGLINASRVAKGAVDEPPLARERLKHLLNRAGFPLPSAEIPPARSIQAREKALAGLPELPVAA
jgi:hypothetical protein